MTFPPQLLHCVGGRAAPGRGRLLARGAAARPRGQRAPRHGLCQGHAPHQCHGERFNLVTRILSPCATRRSPAEHCRGSAVEVSCARVHVSLYCAWPQVLLPHNQQPTQIRIGLHTGTCVSGLVGSRLPKFSIYGDSINFASRMEVRPFFPHAPRARPAAGEALESSPRPMTRRTCCGAARSPRACLGASRSASSRMRCCRTKRGSPRAACSPRAR